MQSRKYAQGAESHQPLAAFGRVLMKSARLFAWNLKIGRSGLAAPQLGERSLSRQTALQCWKDVVRIETLLQLLLHAGQPQQVARTTRSLSAGRSPKHPCETTFHPCPFADRRQRNAPCAASAAPRPSDHRLPFRAVGQDRRTSPLACRTREAAARFVRTGEEPVLLFAPRLPPAVVVGRDHRPVSPLRRALRVRRPPDANTVGRPPRCWR